MPQAQGSVVLFGPNGQPLGPEAFRRVGGFGPGLPLPAWQAEPNAPPQEHQYPDGFNLTATPRGEDAARVLRFATLRAWRTLPYVSTAIDYRKAQVRATEWKVVPRDRRSKTAVQELAKTIARVERFFAMPYARQMMEHGEWISQVVEDVMAIDACVLFRWHNRLGELHSLMPVDGTTIKVVINGHAEVVGFQQVLHGRPQTFYPAFEQGEDGDIKPGRLVYKVMNPRSDSPYGTPPIETIPAVAELVTKRWSSWLAWYTEGNVPSSTMTTPEGWSPDDIKRGQSFFDLMFSGDERQRHKVRLIPAKSEIRPLAGFTFNKEESEELKRVISAHFGVPPSIFVEPVNRATAETMQAQATDTGHRPLVLFLKALFDQIIKQDFGTEELERIPVQTPAGTELERAQTQAVLVNARIITADEARADRGMEPMANDQAALEQKPDGDVPTAPPKPPKPMATEDGGEPDAANAELAKWHRFAARRLAKGRHADPFDVEHLSVQAVTRIRAGLKTCRTREDLARVFDGARTAATSTDNRFAKAFAA